MLSSYLRLIHQTSSYRILCVARTPFRPSITQPISHDSWIDNTSQLAYPPACPVALPPPFPFLRTIPNRQPDCQSARHPVRSARLPVPMSLHVSSVFPCACSLVCVLAQSPYHHQLKSIICSTWQ